MKKTLLLVITILLFCNSSIFADGIVTVDEQTSIENSQPIITEDMEKNYVKSSNKYFDLELVRGYQNPLNNNITYTLTVTPKIDSSQTQITWDLPTTLIAKPRHKEFVDLKKDQVYTFKANIAPQRGGTYDVTVNVNSWQPGINYTNSVSSTITLGDNKVVQPTESSYIIFLVFFILGSLVISGVLIYILSKYSKTGIARLRKWLTPPI